MTNRTPFYVYPINEELATTLIRERTGNPRVVAEPMVAILGANGIATVCTEGVGWYKNHDNDKYTLLYDDINSFGLWIEVTFHDLARLLVNSQPVNLADFIRVFGARLESNFDLWHYYGKNFDQDLVLPLDNSFYDVVG